MYTYNLYSLNIVIKYNNIMWFDFEFSWTVVNQFQGYSEAADDADKTIKEEEKIYLPLGEGVLDSNLGIPLIVVGTKVIEFFFYEILQSDMIYNYILIY